MSLLILLYLLSFSFIANSEHSNNHDITLTNENAAVLAHVENSHDSSDHKEHEGHSEHGAAEVHDEHSEHGVEVLTHLANSTSVVSEHNAHEEHGAGHGEERMESFQVKISKKQKKSKISANSFKLGTC